MSIVDNGTDVHVEYQIPDEIKSKIPQHFYSALAGELCSVFGRMIFDKDESGVYGISYIGGTTGWMEALKMTSEKFHQTILMITHNPEIAKKVDVRIRIEDGKIVG